MIVACLLVASHVGAFAAGATPTAQQNPSPTPNTSVPIMQKLPLFYQTLSAFDPQQHGQLSFAAQPPDYAFAAQANIIPLLVNEASQAMHHYPLVFVPGAAGEPLVLAVMVGVGDNVNRFVGANHQWRANSYIPAYVRQYPFLGVRTEDGQNSMLGIDTSAAWIKTKAAGALTLTDADGKPSARLEQVVAFAREFQMFAERTTAMVQALQEAGVLEEGNLRIESHSAGGEARQINGFFIVNEAKLNALSEAAVLKLHKSGALGLAYAQMLSLSMLPNLLQGPNGNSAASAKPAMPPSQTTDKTSAAKGKSAS